MNEVVLERHSERVLVERLPEARVASVVALLNRQPWLRLSQLARLVAVSPSRLRHLFKEELGRSIGAYGKELQLTQARVLLVHSSMTLKEIGSAVGIPDTANFVRYFKQRYGVTPARYRRQLLGRVAVLTEK